MKIYNVAISAAVDQAVADHFSIERGPEGLPSVFDFESGPLAAARYEFARFDELPQAMGPSIRFFITTDPFFGAVTFTGVRVGDDDVEIAEVGIDPDYWSLLDVPD